MVCNILWMNAVVRFSWMNDVVYFLWMNASAGVVIVVNRSFHSTINPAWEIFRHLELASLDKSKQNKQWNFDNQAFGFLTFF